MADICIVYAHENKDVAERLNALLSARWVVWWDDQIVGNYRSVIEHEIPNAKCLIPIWSAHSKRSDVLMDEMDLAKKHGVSILPAKTEVCSLPIGYGSFTAVDLFDQTGGLSEIGFAELLRKVAHVAPPTRKAQRLLTLPGPRPIALPNMFFSASSFETQISPLDAVRVQGVFKSKSLLVSAYDLPETRVSKDKHLQKSMKVVRALSKYRKEGGSIVIDSGNYEASRLKDKEWTPRRFGKTLTITPHDWAFSFDTLDPPRGSGAHIKSVLEAVKRDSRYTSAPVLPIVHVPRFRDRSFDFKNIPAVIRRVSEELNPPLIAIAERELGDGIVQRARSIRKVREELGKLPYYQPLHILGTGNLWSIAILAAAGADSFDGLEWCRVAADGESLRLHHFQHFDFFSYQDEVAESHVTRRASTSGRVDFAGRVVLHNLDVFTVFLDGLQKAVSGDKLEAFVVSWLGRQNGEVLSEMMPELFE